MKVEYVSPFVDAAIDVLREIMSVNDGEVKRGKLSLSSGPGPGQAVTTVVRLKGELNGCVHVAMSRDTAIKVGSEFTGEAEPGMNSRVRSSVVEMTEMIASRASARIRAMGYGLEQMPPYLLAGRSAGYQEELNGPALEIPVESPCGILYINVSISE